ncbi:DMT family transporter [Roseivivax sediminis]|uniref:S-adenosylmethionine uptake transporter n=1 Tax=Roseivivax sediminis TaxID=936889 RepID=A0A1I2ENL8_9RHOB|nr:DMT family transporter [Roseivivax sediminis]SFE94475.1 S-adenosylmethionine uptake transporter [Roseivivax sediminis]
MTRLSDNARGAVLMMGSMAAFTANDALVKRAGEALPLMQILVMRGVVASLALAALAWALGAFRVRPSPRDIGLVGFRSLMEVGAAFLFLTALMNMPLANVTALLQTLPLTVTLAGALLLGEPVGWKRWSAIAVGFAGMLLIVRPGTSGFDAWSVYALVAVLFVTARDLVVRRMSPGVPSILVTLSASVAVTVFAALASVGQGWAQVTAREGALVLGAAVLVSGAYLLSVLVMRVGEVSAVAPFRYTGLVWALLLGWVVFGDWPESVTLAGVALIAASGVFTLRRERRLRRRQPEKIRRT